MREWRQVWLAGCAMALTSLSSPALAAEDPATIASLQRQIDELRAQVQALLAAQQNAQTPALPPTAPAPVAPAPAAAPVLAVVTPPAPTASKPGKPKPWYAGL